MGVWEWECEEVNIRYTPITWFPIRFFASTVTLPLLGHVKSYTHIPVASIQSNWILLPEFNWSVWSVCALAQLDDLVLWCVVVRSYKIKYARPLQTTKKKQKGGGKKPQRKSDKLPRRASERNRRRLTCTKAQLSVATPPWIPCQHSVPWSTCEQFAAGNEIRFFLLPQIYAARLLCGEAAAGAASRAAAS